MAPDNLTENQELEEILNEIESLQEELRENSGSESAPEEPVAEADTASSPMASLSLVTDEDEVVEDENEPKSGSEPATPAMSGFALLDAAIEKDLAETQPKNDEDELQAGVEDAPMEENDPGNDGSLTMTLKGSMTLKLNYECAGQTVSVSFGGEFMKVMLADGTEFKIPVGKKPPLRTLKAV